jgi:hypothetical protein
MNSTIGKNTHFMELHGEQGTKKQLTRKFPILSAPEQNLKAGKGMQS